jgi:hypothetical protein
MFKRLFFLSGILAIIATGIMYYVWMVPKVDVQNIAGSDVFQLSAVQQNAITEGQVVTIRGIAGQSGRSLLGKTELFLTDESRQLTLFCTFVLGEPLKPISEGDSITIKGDWKPLSAPTQSGAVTVLGTLTDCVIAK